MFSLDRTREHIPNTSLQRAPRSRLERKSESLDLDVFPSEILVGFGSSLFSESGKLKTKFLSDGGDGVGEVLLGSGDVGGELNPVVHEKNDFLRERIDCVEKEKEGKHSSQLDASFLSSRTPHLVPNATLLTLGPSVNNVDSLSGGDHSMLHNSGRSVEFRELLERFGRSGGDELLPVLWELGRVLGRASEESEDRIVGFELQEGEASEISERSRGRAEERGGTNRGRVGVGLGVGRWIPAVRQVSSKRIELRQRKKKIKLTSIA